MTEKVKKSAHHHKRHGKSSARQCPSLKLHTEFECLVLDFHNNVDTMNAMLDDMSNAYEGKLLNRRGHNFPASFIPSNHQVLGKWKLKCKYVVAVAQRQDLAHELLHAKFYCDAEYRKQIEWEWENELTRHQRDHITAFLKRLGYGDKVIVDEYQAYRYSEEDPSKFFGIKLVPRR